MKRDQVLACFGFAGCHSGHQGRSLLV